jgi:hypothetical protein
MFQPTLAIIKQCSYGTENMSAAQERLEMGTSPKSAADEWATGYCTSLF